MAETEILLESGTNEIEVMQFTINDELYGINVAKVKEIMMSDKVKPVPHAHEAVEGIFKPREILLTVVDLPKYLMGHECEKHPKDLFIITNFNKLNIAFHVDEVCGIHRLSWADIITPDATINIEENGVSTGVIKLEDRLIVILDFEKIVTDISPETGLQVSDLENLEERNRSDSPIMVAEDSPLLSKLITDCLKKSGYTKLNVNNNGQELWDKLTEFRKSGELDDKVHMVITDIEMPLMDGHRLTKLIKEDDELKHIPVVIFSSLVNEEMRRKGEMLGADAQLTKPEIGKLVSAID